jgi:hydroxymethylpyrimidine/phosphomethylpyrimidine kinase
MIKKALTIAGSDSGGGAGIQADLKTFMAFGVFGMSAITALTAQNTVGVQGIFEISPEFIREQIKSVMDDIGTDAAKTGMLSNETIVGVVSEAVKEYGIRNLVVDPVMIAKSGDSLLAESARQAIKEKLIPLAEVITPNTFEAEALTGKKIDSLRAMREAAEKLKKLGCGWVVLKGGHLDIDSQSIDVIYNGDEYFLVKSERFKTKNTHGTGCTFASAIAAGLAKGWPPLKAIQEAKYYISEAIRTSFAIGRGYGPTNHMTGLKTR